MNEKPKCPKCESTESIKSGRYRRKRSRHLIQRYKCKKCNHSFSDQTHSHTYKQKRPDLNELILTSVCVGVGIRKTALACMTTKTTVQRKIKFLADICDKFHKKHMSSWSTFPEFQFDEMETCETNRFRTVGVPVVMEKKSHFLVGTVAQYILSRSQYPKQKNAHNSAHKDEINQKAEIIKEQLKLCRKMVPKGTIRIDTDMHRSYPGYIKEALGENVAHFAFNAQDPKQKEKLFPVNNIAACMRADKAMLRRRTWHICKDKTRLSDHLKMYIFFSNYFKEKTYSLKWKDDNGQNHKTILAVETPAQALGIFNQPIRLQFVLKDIKKNVVRIDSCVKV